MADQDPSRVDAIIEQLVPLAGKQTGAPLRADDWNVLVGAVGELAKIARARALGTADALAAGYAPAEHAHRGQVGIEWFDAPTRDLVEGRAGAEFTVRDDIRRLDKGVGLLRTDVEGLKSELSSLRELVLQLRDEVIGGNRKLGTVEQRVEALKDLELGVERIGRDFGKLGGRLDEVLLLRDKIGDGEGQVDLGGLDERVAELEKMRAQLIGNSPVPDLRAIQQELIQLNDRVDVIKPPIEKGEFDQALLEQLIDTELGPTRERLDTLEANSTRIDEHLGQLDGKFDALPELDGFDARLDGFDTRLGQLDARATGFESQLAGVDGRFAAFDERLAGVDGLITDKLTAGLAGLELGADPEALAGLDERLGALETGLADVDGRLSGLGENVATRVELEQLAGRVSVLDESAARVDALEQSFAEAGAGLDDLGARLRTLETNSVADKGSLADWRNVVDGKLGTLDQLAAGTNTLGQRVDTLDATVGTWSSWRTSANARIDSLEVGVSTAGEARTVLANQIAGHTTQLGNIGTQLSSQAASIQQLSSWRGSVDAQLGSQATRLSAAESSLATLDRELSTTSNTVRALGESLASTSKTVDALSNWRTGVDEQLSLLDRNNAELVEWRVGVDKRLGDVSRSLDALPGINQRLNTVEASTTTLNNWRKQTDAAISSLQVNVAKTSELSARVDKLDSQVLKLETPIVRPLTERLRGTSLG